MGEKMNKLSALVMFFLLAWSINCYSQPDELIIWAEPSDVPVKISLSEITSPSEDLLSVVGHDKNRAKYLYKISADSDGVFLKYYLSALDSNTNKKITDLDIWIPSIIDKKEVLIVLKKPDVTEKTILDFSRRGLKGPNAYRTYFEARTIYQEVEENSPNHYMGGLASFWWFSAAYELAKRENSIIPMDSKAIDAIENLIRHSEENDKYNNAMKAWKIKTDRLRIEADRAKRVKWQGYSLVRKARKKKQYDIALDLLIHYEEMYNIMPLKEKKKVSEEYGIYSKVIHDDKIYLQQLVKKSNAPSITD